MAKLKKLLAVLLVVVMMIGIFPTTSLIAIADEPWTPPFTPTANGGIINLTGANVDAALQFPNSLPWKGFGMLHCNSTSALLLDYKAEHPDEYWRLLEFLFGGDRPLITKIKNEMGMDQNMSTGSDEATMRDVVNPVTGVRTREMVADTSRPPGFQFMADAKTINPDVKTSTLRWGLPSWINDTGTAPGTAFPATAAQRDTAANRTRYEALYEWHKQTIIDQYYRYGFVWDEIAPDHNENNNPNPFVIRYFYDRVKTDVNFPADLLADEYFMYSYRNMKFLGSDENSNPRIAENMMSSAFNPMPNAAGLSGQPSATMGLRDIIDIVAWHYNMTGNTQSQQLREQYDKEMWYSEACASFSMASEHLHKTVGTGGPGNSATSSPWAGSLGGFQSPLSMLDAVLCNFNTANARRTHMIFQPLIGAMYEGHQYCHKNLLSMVDPWSGYIQYDENINLIAHIQWFANTGWEKSNTPKDMPAAERTGVWYAIPQASRSFPGNQNSNEEHRWNGGGNEAGTAGHNVPSYMTLAAPTKDDFSIVFANNTAQTMRYRLNYSGMLGKLADGNAPLEIWETRAGNYMNLREVLQVSPDGNYYFEVAPTTAVTVTTLNNAPLSWRNQGETPDEAGTRLHGMRVPVMEKNRDVLDFSRDPEAHDYLDLEALGLENLDDVLFADDFGAYHNDPKVRGVVINNIEKFLKDGGKNPELIEKTIVSYGEAFGWQPRFAMMNTGAFEVIPLDDPSKGTPGTLRSLLNRNPPGQWNGSDSTFFMTFGDFRWMDYTASMDVHFPTAPNHAGTGTHHAFLTIRSQGNMGISGVGGGYNIMIRPTGDWQLRKGTTVLESGQVAASRDFNIGIQGLGRNIKAFVNGEEVASIFDGTNRILSGRMKLGCNYGIVEFDNLLVTKTPGGIPYAQEFLWALSNDVVTSPGNWSKSAGNAGGAGHNSDWGRSRATSRGTTQNPAWLEFSIKDGTGFAIIGNNTATPVFDVLINGELYRSFQNPFPNGGSGRNESYVLTDLERGDYDVRINIRSGNLIVTGIYIFTDRMPRVTGIDEVKSPALTSLFEDDDLNAILPKTVLLSGYIVGEGSFIDEEATVVWNPVSLAGRAHQTVNVTGIATHERTGLTARVTAPVEVIPRGLIYWVNLGTGQGYSSNSPSAANRGSVQFDAVLARAVNLRNPISDQPSPNANTWGWARGGTATMWNIHARGSMNPTSDKYETFVYGENNVTVGGASITYRFPVEAGTYQFAMGIFQHWGARNYNIDVRAGGVTTRWATNQSTGANVRNLVNTTRGLSPTSLNNQPLVVTMTNAGVIEIIVSRQSGDAPVLSWVTVAKTSACSDSSLGAAIFTAGEELVDLIPEFDPEVLAYEMFVDRLTDSIAFELIASSENAFRVTATDAFGNVLNGVMDLAPGVNVLNVSVLSENLYETVYTFTITRAFYTHTELTAWVRVLSGNLNELFITATEVYSDGDRVDFTESFMIRNNAEGIYKVHNYLIFVNTKGNDQIRELKIVEVLVPDETDIPEEPPAEEEIILSAFVVVTPGNTNELTINVSVLNEEGERDVFTETFTIRNNAEGRFVVGDYLVFVSTQGNDKIKAIYLVEIIVPDVEEDYLPVDPFSLPVKVDEDEEEEVDEEEDEEEDDDE